MHIPFETYQEAASFIESQIGSENKPQVAVICGSGLGILADCLTKHYKTLKYDQIPGFVKSTAVGHAGELVFGEINQKRVVCMKGRFHCYEGYDVSLATFPVRVFKLLGVSTLLVTNAAGGLNPDYNVGDLMLFSDHLSLPGIAGVNPLIGPNLDQFGERFIPVSNAYSKDLRERFATIWLQNKEISSRLKLHEGVYGWVLGPSYESRVECRALRSLGCDVVGMSTVPEVVIAKHCGIDTIAISLVTNKAVYNPEPSSIEIAKARLEGKQIEHVAEVHANHEEVLEAANSASKDFSSLVLSFISDLPSL
ncbi:hypothetical protein BB560_002697 [Smittium megazygosporum]|uniref:Purine nucleoside phosphorylase n=1 Tax=Smittium megazygosporum TaxID=133381 RepID=A0A2T9ZE27_9FUNG|nr:hypothetical protein BB560_002697 [Smittium megazygosporum]